MSKRRVVLLPGDGIGPEVVEAARRVVEASGPEIEWVPREIGAVAFEKYGDALPAEVLDEIRRCGIALKGPTTTPIAKGHVSANVRMRKELALFANVRPVKTVPGLETPYGQTDLVIVRENTEDLYSGLENEIAPGIVRQMIYGDRLMLCRLTFAPGTITTAHDHIHEQMTIVEKGRVRFVVGKEEKVFGPGEVLLFPSGFWHGATILDDEVVLLDIFSPIREDFLK